MLKRKNPDYHNSSTLDPPAKRQTLGDITNNIISDPKCTIVPRSPDKVMRTILVTKVYEFKVPDSKNNIITSPNKQQEEIFSPMLISPSLETTKSSIQSCTINKLSVCMLQKQVSDLSYREDSSQTTQSLTQETASSQDQEDICQIDREEKFNPLYAWEYAGHIHTYMLRQEQRHKPTPYLTRHPQLTLSMRHILVDWMVELQESFELYHETLYLAVRLIDRFLAKSRDMQKDKIQLLSACAILIACKYEEVKAPPLEDFIYICADAFERQEFIEMERQICKQLDYDINTPVAYRFLRRYHKASKQSMEVHTLARYIAELTLLDYTMSLELPSQIAISSLYIALRMNNIPWSEEVQIVTGVKEKDILPLAERINSICLKAYHTDRGFNVKSKYSHEVFYQVALKRPLLSLVAKLMCDLIGLTGGKHPCYFLFKEYITCIHESGPYPQAWLCWKQWEDYDECIHHRKFHAKVALIKQEKKRLQKQGVKFEYENKITS
ncbi:G2/mitotic-specific cyclin-B3-like [Oopsacas minuta]|uniref:G2/mitotic-specific cyclin-B3-like n=1 Tax=Oopsacas minuta TaxID=111878 RepID=A0AAV7KFY5_9METZ|nr:G2/mitotic-specific cyclin-B3-like [Oopsacas minuta]